jgi:hypothetical protein
VDSQHCHAHFGASLGGISYPILADFHPKGEVSTLLGTYLPDHGFSSRASVIIDAGGIVRYAAPEKGARDMEALAARCKDIDESHEGPRSERPAPTGIPDGTFLFVKSRCGYSRAALLARDNLHLAGAIPVKNVSDDAAALADLQQQTGKQQAPCLVTPSGPILESADIIAHLVAAAAPI